MNWICRDGRERRSATVLLLMLFLGGAPALAQHVTVGGNVYGGGAMANVGGTSTVLVDQPGAVIEHKVFGGGMAAGVGNTASVTITDGTVSKGVYGGCDASGDVADDITINANGGTIGTNDANTDDGVFGGGYGSGTSTSGNVTVNVDGATVYGDVYGGSALGNVNDAAADITTVNILDGTIHGTIYGGGLGNDTTAALVHGTVHVNIGAAASGTEGQPGYVAPSGSATINGEVFGCNNLNGTPKADVFVDVYKTAHTDSPDNHVPTTPAGGWTFDALAAVYASSPAYAISAVYGGGNLADYNPDGDNTAQVYIHYCDNTIQTVYGGGNAADSRNVGVTIDGGFFDRVFGGGNGYSSTDNHSDPSAPNYNPGANVSGTATTLIQGGYFRQVFGGSNQYGNIGTVSLTFDKTPACDGMLLESFGGGNQAYITGNVTTTLACSSNPFEIGSFYGGSNLADIDGDVTLNVYGGLYTYVFGGSKGEAPPNGATAEQLAAASADISGSVTLNLYGGTMVSAFGGSDVNGQIGGKITVNVNQSGVCDLIVHNVYGGGRDASYTPDLDGEGNVIAAPEVNIINGTVSTVTDPVTSAVTDGNVFGGGLGETAVVTAHPVVNIQGGVVEGKTFGGGSAAPVTGDPTVNVLYGSTPVVHGGGLGSTATVSGNPSVVVNETSGETLTLNTVYGGGDAAPVTGNTAVTLTAGTLTRAFGGGNVANITGATQVTLQGATVSNIYGGGNEASVSSTATVTINSGTATGGVYGGCNASGSVGGAVTVTVDGGTVGASGTGNEANVHGGGYGPSTSTGDAVSVTIGNGTSTPVIYGDVYGGSALGNVNDAVDELTKVWLKSGTVNGSIYGGGLGDASHAALVNGKVQVVVDGGSVTGAVFGCNNVNGTPKGTVEVTINSTPATVVNPGTGAKTYALQAVYGGGNLAHYDPTTPGNYPTVTVNGCSSSVKDVFGGGNAAAVPYTHVTINGGDIDRVFAGGNGESGTAANVGYKNSDDTPSSGSYGAGTANAIIKGGTINQVFGGSNSKGTIRTSGTLNIDKDGSCGMYLGEVYGGGNVATGVASTVTIGCTGTLTASHGEHPENIGTTLEGIGAVYGGANQANITGNIALVIEDGIINNVFGGNNQSGSISGSIAVSINQKATPCAWYVGNVYGGGNQAAYQPTTAGAYPAVNILNGTVSGDVFGGGLGATAKVYSNPVVTIGDLTSGHESSVATVTGNVYGGGSAAMVGDDEQATASTNGTTVLFQKASSTAAKVFGGGMAAGVTGTTSVTINDGTVSAGLYGGCDASGTVGGNITVNATGGTVGTNNAATDDGIFGGGFGHSTSTTGDVTVTLGNTTVYGDLYGGSALGSVNAADKTTTVTVNGSNLHGTVFGGGMGSGFGSATQATTLGNVIVNYNTTNAYLTGLYGGANVNGDVAGDISVNVEANVGASANNISIYGGGFGQYTTTDGDVTVTVGNSTTPTIYGDIYGGSALGEVGATGKLAKVDFKAGTLNGTLYGGGKGSNSTAALVNGDVAVVVTTSSITDGIYGGCNINGTISGDIAVTVNGGTIGTDATHRANIHGGGLGNLTATAGDVTVTFGTQNASHQNTPILYGDLYGGSGYGNVNANTTNTTTVTVLNGEITGNVYGGGLGDKESIGTGHHDYPALVNGNVVVNIGEEEGGTTYGKVRINTYTLSSETKGGCVFGCNNTNGTPKGNVAVNIYATDHGADAAHNLYPTGITSTEALSTNAATQTYAIKGVFGGGNLASYEPVAGKSTTVHVYNCDNTIQDIFGGSNAANVGTTGEGAISANTNIVIDGGRIHRVFGGGNGALPSTAANIYGTATTIVNGGLIDQIFGCGNLLGSITTTNLRLAKGSCTDEVFGEVFGGANEASLAISVNTTIDCGVETIGEVYGGSNKANITGDVVLNIKGGIINNAFGGSKGITGSTAADITGDVILNLYGGTIANAFGGSNYNGAISGSIAVNVLDYEATNCNLNVANIYGAGNLTPYTTSSANYPVVNVMHVGQSSFCGNVYGGGKGSTARVTGNPHVNVGYDATTMNSLPTVEYPSTISSANYTAILSGNLIGGGDEAAVTGSPVVTVYGGEVKERIIGGGNAADVSNNTHIVIYDGAFGTGIGANRGVYGGCNMSGTVGGNVVVDILGGTFGTQAKLDLAEPEPYNIHGGGYGSSTVVTGNVTVNYGTADGTATASAYPKLYGDLYGGSALGTVNTDGNNTTQVNILNGSFGYEDRDMGSLGTVQYGGNIYGGGLGDATGNHPAEVRGVIHVNIGAAPVSPATTPTGKADLRHCNVYGCNNAFGSPQENVYIDVYQTAHTTTNMAGYEPLPGQPDPTYAIQNVFGGGNHAHYAPSVNPLDSDGHPSKRVHNNIHYCDNTIENVYGGGNAADVICAQIGIDGGRYKFVFAGGNGQITAANIGEGGVDIRIYSGRIGWYFEGCNMHGSIANGAANSVRATNGCTVGGTVGDDCPCEQTDLIIENYYFGANMATIYGGLHNEVVCGGEEFEYKRVYAGSRLAIVYGDIELTVRGGKIGNLFGGSEGSSLISADVRKYPTDWNTNRSAYDPELIAFMDSVMTNHSVDLGGTGGNITIRLEGGKLGNVYGGCDYRGNVDGNIRIIVDSAAGLPVDCRLDIDYIYGGNNLARYFPDGSTPSDTRISPLIELKNGHVNYDVYGGSKGGDPSHLFGNGEVVSNPKVVVGDTVSGHTFRIGHIDRTDSDNPIVYGNLHGGGSSANVKGNTEVVIQGTVDAEGKPSTVIENSVFGGGKIGDVDGNTKITIVPEP